MCRNHFGKFVCKCSCVEARYIYTYSVIFEGLQHLVLFPWSPYGLPLNFTTLPQKLKESGTVLHLNTELKILAISEAGIHPTVTSVLVHYPQDDA